MSESNTAVDYKPVRGVLLVDKLLEEIASRANGAGANPARGFGPERCSNFDIKVLAPIVDFASGKGLFCIAGRDSFSRDVLADHLIASLMIGKKARTLFVAIGETDSLLVSVMAGMLSQLVGVPQPHLHAAYMEGAAWDRLYEGIDAITQVEHEFVATMSPSLDRLTDLIRRGGIVGTPFDVVVIDHPFMTMLPPDSRDEVDERKNLSILSRLAKELGITIFALCALYDSSDYTFNIDDLMKIVPEDGEGVVFIERKQQVTDRIEKLSISLLKSGNQLDARVRQNVLFDGMDHLFIGG
jgi:hypothetical protein